MVIKSLILFIATLAISNPAVAQSFEDELLIEAETALADSEAALQEAADAEKIAREEKRKSKIAASKAEKDIARARQQEEQAKKRIAKAERERAKAIDETDKAKISVEEAKLQMEASREEVDRMKMQMEEANSNRALALEKKEMALDQLDEIRKDVKKMRRKLADVKREELSALKDLQRAESKLKRLQDKADISYKNADIDITKFLNSVQSHRDTLNSLAKRLDELEVEVETDRAFQTNQKRNKMASTIGTSVKRGATKVAKVMTAGCNIRNNPTTRADVVGKSRRGKKLRVRQHNQNWYTVVHKGQKAFMGRSCFSN